jgi:hypothetical protein
LLREIYRAPQPFLWGNETHVSVHLNNETGSKKSVNSNELKKYRLATGGFSHQKLKKAPYSEKQK